MIVASSSDVTVRRFDSSEGNVWKYVFEYKGEKPAVAEAVLYRYGSFQKRTVVCCSVQSGCPVGCTFCGTGNNFIRNLTYIEIVEQVRRVFANQGLSMTALEECEKLQIMFMSMGEPFLNYPQVKKAIKKLAELYPNAQLLVSTIAPNKQKHLVDFIALAKELPQVGLQFSLHAANEGDRQCIIPYKHKLSLAEMRDYGVQWWHETGRKPYLNYCIPEDFNWHDVMSCRDLFPPNVFCFTFSVICSSDENMKDAGYRDLERIRQIEATFANLGYDTRVFDPAGQDDIGGGCGQLWWVQRHLQKKG